MSLSNKHIVLWENKEIRKAVDEHRDKKASEVALALSKWPSEERMFVTQQIQGKQKAKDKFPFLGAIDDIIYPLPLSIEQSSSEKTAKYKASLLSGKHFIDLSCGFGIDTYFLARSFENGIGIDKNESLINIVSHNFESLGVKNLRFLSGDSEEFLNRQKDRFDLIYIDPSRRVGTKKVFIIDDCEPNVLNLIPTFLLKSERTMIKLSPMLDISDVIHKVEGLEEIHIVAVDGECKEILLLISEKGHFDGTIVCVDLGKNKVEYSFNRTKESQIQAPTGKVQKYLYLPNASVSKAGAFNSLAKEYDLIKLSSNTHLYTGASQKEDFPGKMFEVIHVLPYNKKMLKNLNAEKGFNIHLRNFPDSIQSLAKKLDIGYSGKEELFAYRNFENKPELAVCRRINADS